MQVLLVHCKINSCLYSWFPCKEKKILKKWSWLKDLLKKKWQNIYKKVQLITLNQSSEICIRCKIHIWVFWSCWIDCYCNWCFCVTSCFLIFSFICNLFLFSLLHCECRISLFRPYTCVLTYLNCWRFGIFCPKLYWFN